MYLDKTNNDEHDQKSEDCKRKHKQSANVHYVLKGYWTAMNEKMFRSLLIFMNEIVTSAFDMSSRQNTKYKMENIPKMEMPISKPCSCAILKSVLIAITTCTKLRMNEIAIRGPGHFIFTIAHFENVWEGLQCSQWIDRLIHPFYHLIG